MKKVVKQDSWALAPVLSTLTALSLILVTLLLSVALVAFDKGFYQAQYIKLDRAAAIGISEEELMDVTDGLMRYLVGLRGDLNMQATIHGQVQEVFGERAKAHMVDVQALFIGGLIVVAAAVLIGIVSFLWLRKRLGGYGARRSMARALFVCVAAVLILLGVAAVLVTMNFNYWFTVFHEVFFSNDLWILDYSEVLIQMVPLEFFIACATRIGIYTGIFWALLLALGIGGRRGRYIGKHEKGAMA